MPTAAVFMGAGLLELEPEADESESLEELLVLVEELEELVTVLMPEAPALPVARPVAVAAAPEAPVAAAPVAEATRDEACPNSDDAAAPPAPVAEASSDVTSPTTLPASEVASPTREPTAEGAPPRALVTWLTMELRSPEAVSRAPLGSTADSTPESAAPRSWAYGDPVSSLVLGVACLVVADIQGLTETAAARPRRIMEERILRVEMCGTD